MKVFLNGTSDDGEKFLKSEEVFLEPNGFKTIHFDVRLNFFFLLHNNFYIVD